MSSTKMLAARACQISAGGQFVSDSAAVPSPCISVCRMSPDRSHCEGCFRTLDEIRAWSQAGNDERRAIWAALLRRAGLALPEELS
ncbi:DUF1289 domain-containing protein [Oryzisolibacter sp. LB2S]|uniref:DUF1289 domain-containing protein n=1 Tax=Alicycliphilus soli TaxID=3228789 RepID=UPI00345967F3